MTLTPEFAETYRRVGYVSPIKVLDCAGAAARREQFDSLEQTEGRERSRIGLVDCHFDQPFIFELATHPAIVDVVEALMGPDIFLLASHFFCKYGQEDKFVAWHQDLTYWGLEPPLALTAWYAVDDSDRQNGCMRVLPGTHDRLREHGKSSAEGNLLSINQEAPVTAAEVAAARDLELRAGEISIHHGMLIHGSLPNRSTRRRCGLTLRYTTPEVRQAEAASTGRPWRPILVRGEDRYRHFSENVSP